MNSALIVFATLSLISANEPKLNDIISALDKATSFFESTYDRLSVDGVAGFRLLQAELGDAMKKWSLSGSDAATQLKKLDDLVRRLDFTSVKAIKAMKINDPMYFKAFQQVLHVDFWTLKPGWTQTDSSLVYPEVRILECFGEEMSDRCMIQLLGTWEDNGVSCQKTETCSRLMMALNCPDYSLSHQLLYMIIIEHKGCSNIFGAQHMDSKSFHIIEDYKKIFCSNMMQRNLEIENNDFPYFQQDLFLENVMLCGHVGFSDFYKARWLEYILVWQQSTGCFGKPDEPRYSPREEQYVFTKHKRVKRRVKHLKGGCSDHMTSVAVGALGGYLRFYGTS
ncbi:UPF0764 protein C16orf89 homolog [Scyliorhinus canicula]|uniref:UPF0764 protein C16orf89 homolog n=1 Tax=Scyliorhinus canicula TaxID=7830 RepID=UPI0018F77BE2|nr:UPF0764 protein C16orf89 homolog [Scyliorhinus canicula]